MSFAHKHADKTRPREERGSRTIFTVLEPNPSQYIPLSPLACSKCRFHHVAIFVAQHARQDGHVLAHHEIHLRANSRPHDLDHVQQFPPTAGSAILPPLNFLQSIHLRVQVLDELRTTNQESKPPETKNQITKLSPSFCAKNVSSFVLDRHICFYCLQKVYTSKLCGIFTS